MGYYAGIGSRETPPSVRPVIRDVAVALRELGFTLRSGGADGADTYFEEFAGDAKQIFLPRPGFNGSQSAFLEPSPAAVNMACKRFPWIIRKGRGTKNLVARNMHQVLGPELDDPVKFVVCWTRNGLVTGGTAYAIQLAYDLEIPVYNLANLSEAKSLFTKIEEMRNEAA